MKIFAQIGALLVIVLLHFSLHNGADKGSTRADQGNL